jgi:pimeloyl-ACP methyl ester carboxylesterase
MAETSCDGLRITYDDLGAGEPTVLCLPGWCANRTAFTAVAAALAARRRVLALDWRGHGGSARPDGDFGRAALVRDAIAVIEASGARQIVPLATAHAGWVAIELRSRLGAARVPKLALVDWIVSAAPAPFLAALGRLGDPAEWQATRDGLFAMWLTGVEHAGVVKFVREEMGAYHGDMWARAGREIAAAYAAAGSPLEALAGLDPPAPTLHLFARGDPAAARAQEEYAATQPWLRPLPLDLRSHFPTLEAPELVAAHVETFIAGP